MAYRYTTAITLLALLFYILLAQQVSRARTKYGVKAPAVSGNENFERIYRVHLNTLEQLPFFLPSMWLYAMWLSDVGAAVGGLIWIVGRLYYTWSYLNNPASRATGFIIAFVAAVGLYLGAAYGVIKALL